MKKRNKNIKSTKKPLPDEPIEIEEDKEPSAYDLYNYEIGRRPILQLYEAIKEGIYKTDKNDQRFLPFKYQLDFLRSKKTNTWIIGANRSGKSFACFVKSALTLLGFNKLIPPPNDGWIVSVDWTATRDISIPMLLDLIPNADIASWSKSEKTLRMKNGSTCVFKSADSGRIKFQAAGKDWVQIDEEIKKDIYLECKIRCKANRKLYVWGAALPFSGQETYLFTEIFQRRGFYTMDVFQASTYDNLALLPEQIAELEESFSGAEKKIRLLGQFVTLTGDCIFDAQKLQAIKERYCKVPELNGNIIPEGRNTFDCIADNSGLWKIWEKPQKDKFYSIGVDVATGEGKDNSCIQILEVHTRCQVASFCGKVSEDELALEIIKSANYYNEANVIIEITGYGRAVQNIVMKDYFNLYRREDYDKFGEVTRNALGWETKGGQNDGGTKPLLIADGRKYVREMGMIRDVDTVLEFMNYIRHPDKSAGARSGTRDDRVIAYLLALRQINEGKCDGLDGNSEEEKEKENFVSNREERLEWLHL